MKPVVSSSNHVVMKRGLVGIVIVGRRGPGGCVEERPRGLCLGEAQLVVFRRGPVGCV